MKTRVIFCRLENILITFKIPAFVAAGIVFSLLLKFVFPYNLFSTIILICVIAVGSFDLVKNTAISLVHKKMALDYIALLAITVAVLSGQFLVAAVIVLMLTGGNTLENYGMSQAQRSLSKLTDRIPNSVYLWENNHMGKRVLLDRVQVGQSITVRKGEVIPLDGFLISEAGLTDESSLTGEPYIMEKIKGDQIRSGTVNAGDIIVVKVTKIDKDSTYRKIIEMVKQAQREKAPLIRLADRYSTVFTLITLSLAAGSYLLFHDITRVLSILVIATPCPLILATPIALMGGMNASAKRRIIMKKISSLEILSRVNTIIFDKTGTITLGKPFVKDVIITDPSYTHDRLCSIAEAIERNSLHPLAKAIIASAHQSKHTVKHATDVKEKIGVGITGTVEDVRYTLSKIKDYKGMAIQILIGQKQIAIIEFEDKIKENSQDILHKLKKLGLHILIFTGDKKEAAEKVIEQLGEAVTLKAECSPEDKKDGIAKLKKQGKVTAMVGDGINDAPALALADVGMVFSNEEQTAASEAADVVFLGGDFTAVTRVIDISKRTIRIALQSILFGIGASTLGMVFAALGFIPPITGAFIQETIDILVIFNALRASK